MTDIVVLIGQSNSGPMVINQIKNHFPGLIIIRESKVPKKKMLQRRVKKLGIVRVFGQLLFILLVPKILTLGSRKQLRRIEDKFNVSYDLANLDITDVDSVNSDHAIAKLKSLSPKLVLVIGTRIIGTKTLECINAQFINIHVGLTPLFRGVHGGYWAKVKGRKVGTTIHFIDKGIDTGQVIRQFEVELEKQDNFLTYPLQQMVQVIPDLIKTIHEILQGEIKTTDPIYKESKLWSHPTLWSYLYHRIFHGVK